MVYSERILCPVKRTVLPFQLGWSMAKQRNTTRRYLAPVLLVFSVLPLLIQCTKRDTAARSEEARGTAEVREEQTEVTRLESAESQAEARTDSSSRTDSAEVHETSIPLEPVTTNAGNAPARTSTRTTEIVLGPLASFIVLDREVSMTQSDPVIGALLDRYSADAERREIFRTVSVFLESLAKGRIADDTVAPDARREFARSLAYALESGVRPRTFRIGEVQFSGDRDAHLKVRLLVDSGSSDGEIYLEKVEDGSWLIADHQLDLASLSDLSSPDTVPQGYES